MFIRQIKAKGIEKKSLEAGREIVIVTGAGRTISGIVDFINRTQGSTHIFIEEPNQRFVLRIWSDRKIIELVSFTKASIETLRVKEMFVTVKGNRVPLEVDVFVPTTGKYEERYEYEVNGFKNVPVVPGDEFTKGNSVFKVIAITKNGGTMFMESESGKGLAVDLNDSSLIFAFGGQFSWGDLNGN